MMRVQLRLTNISAVEHTSDTVQLSGSDSSLLKIQVCWAVMTLSLGEGSAVLEGSWCVRNIRNHSRNDKTLHPGRQKSLN
jgi:hypothetical protein